VKYVRQLFHFLYDFLVGDAWELFVGPIVGLVAASLLLSAGLDPAIVGGVIFVAILVVGGLHLTAALEGSA
jgi:hypothetical protein